MRNLAKVQKPTIEITMNGDTMTLKTKTTFKNSEISFKLGEEFEEDRLDGAKVKSTMELDGNKLVQKQMGDKPCEIIRQIDGDKLTTVSSTASVSHHSFLFPSDLQMC